MDRPTTRMDADARTPRPDLPAAFLPSSRQATLDLGLAALGAGPILLTGDAGIGKTWMVGRWTELVATCRWLAIDLTPADGPGDLYRQLARGLGIATTGPTRLDIADALADRAADDEVYSLVIDEAHNLAPEVWEEVRVLSNRLGQPDGFRHLILAGQTPLVRRFATRPLAAVAARLAAHLHLRPMTVAEAAEWLDRRHPAHAWSPDEFETLHRDAGGNPARLIRHCAAIVGRSPALPAPAGPTDHQAPIPAQVAVRPTLSSSLGADARPPLHVAENSIEVGWDADDVDAPGGDDQDDDQPADVAARLDSSDQAVNDHYAALQAWREWADNQEKRASPAKSDRDLADAIDEAAEAEAADPAEMVATDRGSVRAEGHQHFAPFGQLFTRMGQVRDPGLPQS